MSELFGTLGFGRQEIAQKKKKIEGIKKKYTKFGGTFQHLASLIWKTVVW